MTSKITEKMIKELEKDILKDIDTLKNMLKENKEKDIDINKGKAEIHIEKEDLSVKTKMSGNPIVLISLLTIALKEIQDKHNISDEEVKKIRECSHTFGREER